MGIDRLGQIWPEWKVEEKLGEGSFGRVYKAVREDTGVIVSSAIKVISIPKSDAELNAMRTEGMSEESTKAYFLSTVEDFVNEIKLMDSLKGTQNIVSVEDFKVLEKSDEFGWDIFIRMELLTNFTEFMSNEKLSETEVIKLGVDILKALQLCSKLKVVHRDIKPENIFVSTFGDFKLGDFGIARELGKTSGNLSSKGTFNYMAPEVASGGHYDATVDSYSLGIVLYKLLNNNRIPFLDPHKQQLRYEDFASAVEKRKNGEPLPAPIQASKAMAQVILKASAHNPCDRYQSPAEFRQALEAINISETAIDEKMDETSALPFSTTSATLDDVVERKMDETVYVRQAPVTTGVNELSTSAVAVFEEEKKESPPILMVVTAIFLLSLFCVGAFFVFINNANGRSESEPATAMETVEASIPMDMQAVSDDHYDNILGREAVTEIMELELEEENDVVRIIITGIELEEHPIVLLTLTLYDANNEAVTKLQENGFRVYENDVNSEIQDVSINEINQVMVSYISPASFAESGNRGIRIDYSNDSGLVSAFSAYILEADDIPRVDRNPLNPESPGSEANLANPEPPLAEADPVIPETPSTDIRPETDSRLADNNIVPYVSDFHAIQQSMFAYQVQFANAVANYDFNLVRSSLDPDGSFYGQQRDLIENYQRRGIRLQLIDVIVGDITPIGNVSYLVAVTEMFYIQSGDETASFVVFENIYTVRYTPDGYKVSELNELNTVERHSVDFHLP